MAESSSRHSAADKAAAYAADPFEKSKTTAKESTKAVEQTYVAASKSVIDFNLKLIEMAEQNVSVAIEFARRLPELKSPTAFFELSAEHARKQFEAFTRQTQELAGLTQKALTEATESWQSAARTYSQPSSWGA
jgi:hypothetical protein